MHVKTRKWYQKEPTKFSNLQRDLIKKFPTLRIQISNEKVIIVGMFPVKSNKATINEYLLEIILPDNYPEDLPAINELQGKIPRTPEWHTNGDGTLCPVLPSEYWSRKSECRLIEYLENEVTGLLLAADYFRLKGHWPFSEHRHGYDGYRDYYGKRLGIENPTIVQEFINDIHTNRLKGHFDCPCKSGKKLRNCHATVLWQLRAEMPQDRIRNHLRLNI